MYLIISIISLFTRIFLNSFADDIRWSEHRHLTYSDFTGPVPSSSHWAATTKSNILFSYDFRNNELHGVVVYSSFTPSKSWMKNKIPAVLKHEQLHFDITELLARKLYAQASELIGSHVTPEQLKELFKKANADCNDLQNEYDDESEHGVDEEKQSV